MKEFKIVDRITVRTNSLNRYINEISKIELLNREDELDVATRASAGDCEAKHLLIKSNLRFVMSVAKMYYNTQENPAKFEDLINEGNVGLTEAVETFDPTCGAKFISYAVWHIRKCMLNYLNNLDRTIRVPMNVNNSIINMNRLEGKLAGRLNRDPTRDELIDLYLTEYNDVENKASKRTIKDALILGLKPADLDSPLKSDSNFSLLDTIDANPFGIDKVINSKSNLEYLLYYVNRLRFDIDKDIIISKLGLDGDEPKSVWEIARKWDMSTANVNIRFNRAVKQLHYKLTQDKITEDYFRN